MSMQLFILRRWLLILLLSWLRSHTLHDNLDIFPPEHSGHFVHIDLEHGITIGTKILNSLE